MKVVGFIFSLFFHLFLVYIFVYQIQNNIDYKRPAKIRYELNLVTLKKKKAKTYSYKKAKIKIKTGQKIATVGGSKQKVKLSKKQIEALKRKQAQEELESSLAALKQEEKLKSKEEKGELDSALQEIQGEVKEDKEGSAGVEIEEFYQGIVESKIKANFRYPNFKFGKLLICFISIKINERGEILEYHLKKSSGDEVYDSLALRAILDTKVLPLPPPGIREKILREGIEIEFNSQELEGSK
ncbi:MAG: Protein TolA [Desulfonauticus sp. 38_4375]|nr:MAG: Protein TolA [Desulfonauticus sp. 38_4375]